MVMLFLMSNGITRADYIAIDNGKIYSGSLGNFNNKRGERDAESVGLNARKIENKDTDKNEIARDKVAEGSVAIGFGAETKNENFQGKYAVAIGHNSTALAENSISIGKDSYTLASGSIAIGKGAIVEKNSNDSIAFGKGTKTVGKNNTNVGQLSQVTGEKNQVVGYANKVKGDQNLVFGSNVTIDGVNNAIVFGNESKPISGAVSFGNATTTRQLKYIAEGTDDTDAVNFRQLRNYVGNELGKIKLKQGNDGKSAYDVWKEYKKKQGVNDSDLTEEKYLESIKGARGEKGEQ